MNIKFGTDNFYVRYLKRFLNHELAQSNAVLGKFDEDDLQSLITYINLPNVKDMFEIEKDIVLKFPELDTLFVARLYNDQIIYTSRQISESASNFIIEKVTEVKEYCKSVGWELVSVQDWIDLGKDLNNDGVVDTNDMGILNEIIYNHRTYDELTMKKADLNLDGKIDNEDITMLQDYLNVGKLQITIQKSDRKNYFPNEDMKVFINQFKGLFLYNYAIRDVDGQTDMPHPNNTGLLKIALFQCKPGQKLTIAHNNYKTTHLVIGSSPARLKQDIPSMVLNNVVEVDLKPGEGYQYTCSSMADGTGYDAYWLCIQCPSDYNNMSGTNTKTISLQVGDINFDGKIDMIDYHLLASYTSTGPGSEDLHWTATPKQLAVMNIDENHTGIDNYDTIKLYKFVTGDPSVPSLGVTYYTYKSGEMGNFDNVSNFLIIDGHYDKSVNIPFKEFVEDDWVIHEKFFNYLLGMSIHKYSNSEDITYLEKLLKEYYPDYIFEKDFFKPGFYSDKVKELVERYQRSKVSYTTGDLNRDNRLTKEDLIMLRNYLDDAKDYNTVRDYLEGKIELTDAKKAELDKNLDGKLDATDLQLYEDELFQKYPQTFRTRADIDDNGVVDENDYLALERELNGDTDNLKQYNIPFSLGWCDVQTENLLELDFNHEGNISEVSK